MINFLGMTRVFLAFIQKMTVQTWNIANMPVWTSQIRLSRLDKRRYVRQNSIVIKPFGVCEPSASLSSRIYPIRDTQFYPFSPYALGSKDTHHRECDRPVRATCA